MSNLEKIQKAMGVLQTFSKIIFVAVCVGVALISAAAVLVATDVLNAGNRFLNFVAVTAQVSKEQLVWALIAAACGLIFSAILAYFAYGYFTAELEEGTPFTNAGADRIKRLGIMSIILPLISAFITEGIYEMIGLAEWNRFDDAGDIIFGICLLLLAVVVRYGAELEQKNKEKLNGDCPDK